MVETRPKECILWRVKLYAIQTSLSIKFYLSVACGLWPADIKVLTGSLQNQLLIPGLDIYGK